LPYPGRRRGWAGLTSWVNAVSGPKITKAALCGPAFEEFFRDAYRPLLRDVVFAGWNPQEAEDAVSDALEEVLERWASIENPRAYARRAAISNLIKNKERGQARTQMRQIQRGDVPPEHYLDPGLLVWEQHEWVKQLLESLPPAQREVVAYMVDTFSQQEIALLLGKTEAAVRQNLRAARRRLAEYLAPTHGDKGVGSPGEEA
jgi:RNA polymerase sigma factor (sigma-70 family)